MEPHKSNYSTVLYELTVNARLMFQGKQQSEIFPQLPDTPWTYLEPGARTQSHHICVYGNTSRSPGSRRLPCTWGEESGTGGERRRSRASGTRRVSLHDETRQLYFITISKVTVLLYAKACSRPGCRTL